MVNIKERSTQQSEGLCQFSTGLKLSMCFNSRTINNNETKSMFTIKQNRRGWMKNTRKACGTHEATNPLNWELFVCLRCPVSQNDERVRTHQSHHRRMSYSRLLWGTSCGRRPVIVVYSTRYFSTGPSGGVQVARNELWVTSVVIRLTGWSGAPPVRASSKQRHAK